MVEMETISDNRGHFARAFSAGIFQAQGLVSGLTEISLSRNFKKGTLRGMHFQYEPHAETKLVRVVRGRAFDVIVDMRPASSAFGKWFGTELDAESGRALYAPRGFAHGFLTLEDNTDVLYQISDSFEPSAASGFPWNDPDVGIRWPGVPVILSPADLARPPFQAAFL